MLEGEEFDVLVDLQTGRYKIHVKCMYVSSQIYRLMISAGGRGMLLRTDFPLVYSQKKRSRPAKWQIEQGDWPTSGAAYYKTCEEIEEYLNRDIEKVE